MVASAEGASWADVKSKWKSPVLLEAPFWLQLQTHSELLINKRIEIVGKLGVGLSSL